MHRNRFIRRNRRILSTRCIPIVEMRRVRVFRLRLPASSIDVRHKSECPTIHHGYLTPVIVG